MKYGNIELHNVCDIVEEPGKEGFTTLRYPRGILEQINEGARRMATHGSGIEIRGMLPPGGEARVALQTLDNNVVPPVVTVYHGCFSGQAVAIGREPTSITVKQHANADVMERLTAERRLPFDSRLVRVCLPPIHPVRILRIEGDLTYPAPGSTPAGKMLCYGSSITHGAHAISPQGTYASHCARLLGYDLINLGVGGSAQMDPAIAQHIAARTDWDLAVLEMGINVLGWPFEKFEQAVDRFVRTIVAAQLDKPVFCIDLFTCAGDFKPDAPKAPGFRRIVKEVVQKINSDRVIHFDGRDILRNLGGLQVDLVHPNDNGMFEMGTNLAEVIRTRLSNKQSG